MRQPHKLKASRLMHCCASTMTISETSSQHRRYLDETRVEASPVIRNTFGHIDRRATIFAPYRQPLKDADDNEGDGGKPADGLEGGKQTNDGRRSAHERERHKKRIFSPYEIADPPKEERPERPNHKSHGEGCQIGDVSKSFVTGWIKLLREDGCQAPKNEKVIPLDHRPGSRGHNDPPNDVRCAATRFDCRR